MGVDRVVVGLLEGGEGWGAEVEARPKGRADRVPVQVRNLRGISQRQQES